MLLNTKKYLSERELKKINKNLNELEKIVMLKKFCYNNIDTVYYEDFDNYDIDDDYADYDDDKYRKTVTIRRLLKRFDRDYYKPIITDRGRF